MQVSPPCLRAAALDARAAPLRPATHALHMGMAPAATGPPVAPDTADGGGTMASAGHEDLGLPTMPESSNSFTPKLDAIVAVVKHAVVSCAVVCCAVV